MAEKNLSENGNNANIGKKLFIGNEQKIKYWKLLTNDMSTVT